MKPVKTAVIGCGAISDIYLSNMINKYATLDVLACCASHRENAEKKAAQFGIRPASTDEILADPEVELIVILTPPSTHYDLVKKALLAGKHVYTEKPFSLKLEQAEELLALAEDKGLLLGSAPETFLGSAIQTGRRALNSGKIGEVTSFHVVGNRNISILAGLNKYMRQPGGGICYDYGVYYLTALVSLLGSIKEVYAKVGNFQRVRKNPVTISPEFGQDYIYENEAQVNAILTGESGVVGTFSLNGDSAAIDHGYFTIHGTKGILRLGDADLFGTEVAYMPEGYFSGSWQTLEPVSTLSDNCRGLGVAQLAKCIREGGEPLASGRMACHVLDIVEKIMESGRSGRVCTTETACERPAAFENWKELLK
jgi:predicted dehydrogenase